ncbi:hypothetical protein [Bacillus pumilus]|nr:hypothetical protein [Bacillus pumilus]
MGKVMMKGLVFGGEGKKRIEKKKGINIGWENVCKEDDMGWEVVVRLK